MTRNPRKTAAQWAELVANFHASNLSQRDFCDKHGIGVSTLDKWKRRLGEQPTAVPVKPGFIRVASPDETPCQVTLQTDYGVTLICPVSMGIDAIAALSKATGRAG